MRYPELDECLVSHAHIDHFGGANRIKEETRARLAVHELDARVLACFEERLVVASKDLDVFWRRAGIGDEERAQLLTRYGATKALFRPQEVDRVLRDGDTLGPGYRVHHVPGHCPGLVCLQVHDVLLTSDHVLARITPHQFPQAITPFAGLEHYFRSLAKIRKLEGINFALGGHEEPIWDLRARIDAIALFHRDRLAKVFELLSTPMNLAAVTRAMFGEQEGYGGSSRSKRPERTSSTSTSSASSASPTSTRSRGRATRSSSTSRAGKREIATAPRRQGGGRESLFPWRRGVVASRRFSAGRS